MPKYPHKSAQKKLTKAAKLVRQVKKHEASQSKHKGRK